jgi:hypothetical protein
MRYDPAEAGRRETCPYCGEKFRLGEITEKPAQRAGSGGAAQLFLSLGVLFLGLMAAVLAVIRLIAGSQAAVLKTMGMLLLAGITVLAGVVVAVVSVKTEMQYRREATTSGQDGGVPGLAFAGLAGTLSIVGALAAVLAAIVWVLS